MQVLNHDVNEGYEDFRNAMVMSVNGVKVKNLAHLAGVCSMKSSIQWNNRGVYPWFLLQLQSKTEHRLGVTGLCMAATDEFLRFDLEDEQVTRLLRGMRCAVLCCAVLCCTALHGLLVQLDT
jgi:hypothetical protein